VVNLGGVMSTLTSDAIRLFKHLTYTQYDFGIIGLNELYERLECLDELMNVKEATDKQSSLHDSEDGKRGYVIDSEDQNIIHLIPLGLKDRWVFTKGDPDPSPSVPHGHKNDKNQSWPKLNPYTRWIFDKVNSAQERISVKEQVALWNDKDFRQFCTEHLLWFIDRNPDYQFKVNHPLRLPRTKH